MKIYVELSKNELYIHTLFQSQIFPRATLKNVYGTIIKVLANDLDLDLLVDYIEFECKKNKVRDIEITFVGIELMIQIASRKKYFTCNSLWSAYKIIITQLLNIELRNQK